MGLNLKCPFSPFIYPIRYKVEFWSDEEVKTKLAKLSTRSYKAKFSQRDKIYLLDLKYNLTYQNIRGKAKFIPIFIP